MKHFLPILGLLAFQFCYSQELDTFQSDSIYATNKINSRTMFIINGNNLQRELITNYNQFGQIRRQIWFMNGEWHYTQIFNYSDKGLLESIIDSTADNNTAEKSTCVYENGALKYRTTINATGDTSDFRYYPSVHETIKRWYVEGKFYRSDTTLFESPNVQKNYRGAEWSNANNKMHRWNYHFYNKFDENGNLIEVVSEAEKPYYQFAFYFYDRRNLLIKKVDGYTKDPKKKDPTGTSYFIYD
jgi:hypothetical protein